MCARASELEIWVAMLIEQLWGFEQSHEVYDIWEAEHDSGTTLHKLLEIAVKLPVLLLQSAESASSKPQKEPNSLSAITSKPLSEQITKSDIWRCLSSILRNKY